MSLEKPERITNPKLLAILRALPCVVCGKKTNSPAHHLTSVGAGGDDVASNLISLCADHHRQAHNVGHQYMYRNFIGFRNWIDVNDRHDCLRKDYRRG